MQLQATFQKLRTRMQTSRSATRKSINQRSKRLRTNPSVRSLESLEQRTVLAPLIDFGDAPDSYGTTLANNGARHIVHSGFFLGRRVDGEQDGMPHSLALGDDQHDGREHQPDPNPDDEDGITFLTALRRGQPVTIDVDSVILTRAPGYLYGWIDANRDGDFLDTGEQVLSAVYLGNTTSFTFPLPAQAVDGLTYARFRLSLNRHGLQPFGAGGLGEVEDYLVQIGDPQLDFGDLPDSYRTTLATDGARHPIDPGNLHILGAIVDPEQDGRPTIDALGDDQDSRGDDEGGITVAGLLQPGTQYSLVAAGSNGGIVQGWMDFNGDGDFNDRGEQVITNGTIHNGTYRTLGRVPNFGSPILSTHIYARFRISDRRNLGPFGLAPNGEVEDYRFEVTSIDYGDLPDQYQTTLTSDGARHIIDLNQRFYLGAGVDNDPDGQVTVDALGDDQDFDGDDEDGVTIQGSLVAGAMISLDVTGTTAPLGQPRMWLQGWIDWNGDGDFFDMDENVITNSSINGGGITTHFRIQVPNHFTGNHVYARFRYSTALNLGPTGAAPDGEVEDYRFGDCMRADFNCDGQLNDVDIDLLARAIRSGRSRQRFDLNGDGILDVDDRDELVLNILGSTYGDANLDGKLDSADLVKIFQGGEFEDGLALNSTWSEGDFNGDGEFDTADLVLALQGGYGC